MPIRILLVSGSTRAASTNTAALRAAHALADDAIATVLYDALAELPAFSPDDDEPGRLPAVVAALRERIAAADGVLFCTPEYAGELPGSFKNLLDWTVGGAEIYGKPVSWINVAGEGRGGGAETALRTVLGYVGAAIAPSAGTRVVVARADVGPDGEIATADVRDRIAEVVRAFAAESAAGGPEAGDRSLRVERHTGPRSELRALFELAEDSRQELDAYIDAGVVLVAREAGRIVGHVQVTDTAQPTEAEVKNMAVDAGRRGRGIGRALLEAAIALARDEGRATLLVATAAADVGNLRFYQRLGFRMRSIERDAFTPATGYEPGLEADGIELRDRVWLDLRLDEPDRRPT